MSTTVLNDKSVMNAGTFSHTSLGNYALTVNANQTIGVTGTLGEVIDGQVTETYGSNQTTNITGTLDLDASTEVDIDAGTINLN